MNKLMLLILLSILPITHVMGTDAGATAALSEETALAEIARLTAKILSSPELSDIKKLCKISKNNNKESITVHHACANAILDLLNSEKAVLCYNLVLQEAVIRQKTIYQMSGDVSIFSGLKDESLQARYYKTLMTLMASASSKGQSRFLYREIGRCGCKYPAFRALCWQALHNLYCATDRSLDGTTPILRENLLDGLSYFASVNADYAGMVFNYIKEEQGAYEAKWSKPLFDLIMPLGRIARDNNCYVEDCMYHAKILFHEVKKLIKKYRDKVASGRTCTSYDLPHHNTENIIPVLHAIATNQPAYRESAVALLNEIHTFEENNNVCARRMAQDALRDIAFWQEKELRMAWIGSCVTNSR